MMHTKLAASIAVLAGVLGMALCSSAAAQVTVQDDFTGASDTNNWKTFNGACLTAGDGTGNIPKCFGLGYYGSETLVGGATGTLPDTAGNGALRFTNGYPGGYHQSGAVVSNFTFDTSGGLQVTFKTVTYRGDSGGGGGDGADGISFYLMDGSKAAGIGAWGGSLAYSCSNSNPPYDGLIGGYIGLGMDEYGNFLNGTTNTLGETGSTNTGGDNTASGGLYQPGRIGLRGAGNVAWANLTASYGTDPSNSAMPYYPASLATSCSSGTYDTTRATCNTCSSGTYDTATGRCINTNVCSAGSYVSTGLAAGQCESCPSGYTFDSTGDLSANCTKTKKGTTTTTGATLSATSPVTPGSAAPWSQLATQKTCKTGLLYNYSNPSAPTGVGNADLSNSVNTAKVMDYPAIPGAYQVLSGVKIANESALVRADAIPITYNLKITQDGLLSLSYSYNGGTFLPVISKQQIKASNGPLPSSFRFGFAGSTGGSTNIHEILCFQATPADLASTSVGVNAKEATKIASGTQAYLAYYYPSNWTGRLTASDLTYDGTTVGIASTANWDASCNLTGVASGKTCPTTTAAGPVAAQGSSSRTILTWDGTNGIAFQWGSLTTAEQNALDVGDTSPINGDRLAYLRGDRTNELYSDASGAVHGTFRARDSVLGDIIDSSPTWVGPPSSPYTSTWKDLLYSSASASENSGTQTYTQYVTTAQTRTNIVYSGANDGLLHGFRSGSFDSTGNYVSTYNDGKEVLAYMPGAVLTNGIHGVIAPSTTVDSTLDYSSSQYSHSFHVDATPDQDELFYGGKWHTWLVGGLGPGGAALYALDVTDPTKFAEANAATLVIGEWTPSTISCSTPGGTTCGTNLGNTYGVPVIRRLHDGKWAVIFGNGFGSSSGDAGIFIMTVDPTDASRTFYYLSTGATGSNGIAYVSPADLDGDHVTDYVYAGDLKGNIWRFDLTSNSESAWAAGSSALFTVSGVPITTKLLLAIVPQTTGSPRLMVDFGTGQKNPQTKTSAVTYASGSHKLYGIWDWNMAAWNTKAGTAAQLASLTAPQSITATNLQAQTFSVPTAGVRDVTANNVCWSGSTTCSSGNTQFGWVLALPGSNEQVIFSPLMFQNAFVVNTTIPASNNQTSCAVNSDTGYTIAVSLATGGSLPGFFKTYNDTSAAASLTNGTGTPFIVLAGGQSYLITQSLGNGKSNGPVACPPGALYCSTQTSQAASAGKRLTWIQRR
ncbi:MAG: pilus assembly protein [Steroidobacteraceae bacterium]